MSPTRAQPSVPAFVINLDRHPERLAFIEEQLDRAGMAAERFPGIDGARHLPTWLKSYFTASRLSPGQIGCAASHLELMRHLVGRGLPAALILEDDAILPANLPALIGELMAALPHGWNIVRLCRAPKRAFRPLAALSGGRELVRYSRIPVGTAGYLVSFAGAMKLMRPRRVYLPNDVEIAHPWLLDLDVLGVVPAPIGQERTALPSAIAATGARGGARRWRKAVPDPRRVVFNVWKLGAWWWARCLVLNATRRM